jgi:hypothetical protein
MKEMKMFPNNMICKQICAAAIILVLFGFAAGLQAEETTLLTPSQPQSATRILSFPSGQCIGNLYLEPESGTTWDSEHVRPESKLEYLSAAQGDVCVPEDRNIKLWVQLVLSPRESQRMLRQNPQAHQLTVADRVRKDPEDLSGLSELEPNGLYWLLISTEMYGRTGTNPLIFKPISRLTGLKILTLSSTGITNEGLVYLKSLRSLRGLELTEASVGNRGLAVLKDLPALEYLALTTGVTDADLAQVAQVSNLRWLRIAGGRMWGSGLAELAKLPRLERLCLSTARGGGQISDRHIKYLEGITRLKSLTLWGVDDLTDASLASISKLKNLEELYFIRADTKFTPEGVASLKNLKNLRKVHFSQTWAGPTNERYGDEAVRQLASLPGLESIKGINYLSAEGMKTLATFRNLKCLHVGLKDRRHDNYYGPSGLSYLSGLGFSSLEELGISGGNALSDADLAALEPLSHLKDVFIMCAGVSDQGLASIGKLKQLERLQLLCPVTRSGLNQLNGLSNLQILSVSTRGDFSRTVQTDELMLDLSGLAKMKDLGLGGLPLQDSDLAFLRHMPLLENLSIGSDSTFPLTGACLRHLRDLRELNRLYISRLSDCTGEDLAHLNGLPKLRLLTVNGDITDATLKSLKGLASLESLCIETDEPISRRTVTDLKQSHPVIEFIHINELPKVQTRPAGPTKRPGKN